MELITTDVWNEELWQLAEPIYHASFEAHTRKKKEILLRMFERRMCCLHLLKKHDNPIGMAITGAVGGAAARFLLIDYAAIHPDQRSRGAGQQLIRLLEEWAQRQARLDGLLIEAEIGPSAENISRMAFWTRCGFQRTEYIHHYIWVPEPYSAWYKPFDGHDQVFADQPPHGEELFRWITDFHRKAYSRR
ncbi:N-acetyltransferase [Paenibacillus sp. CAA11]|uniref:GNAT family N-acetyltransferase n=1 Tax=Paenibacillus sp. CAA11 TaxID=1532905 RepID=UPI000D396BD0|nr:GNAT family N-acetyltransferase [Paenibacillus sp. CAA11]AWB43628.1 N-acetyltransferase [Paenibacillus sp. CAA11]